MKKNPTKPIEPSIAKIYFEKAKDFYESMQTSYDNKKWNTVGLTAVHCAISLSDALLAHFGGVRNTNQDHKSAGKLLKNYIKDKSINNQEKHLTKIISKKNLIEYEGRIFIQKDAEEIKKQAERFFDWTKSLLQFK
jgi:HEPN domain-containing protein